MLKNRFFTPHNDRNCCQKPETHDLCDLLTPAVIVDVVSNASAFMTMLYHSAGIYFMKQSHIIISRKATDAQNGSHAEMAHSFRLHACESKPLKKILLKAHT